MKESDVEQADYSPEEAQRRFEAALRAALNTLPRPQKDVPRTRPESKRKAGRAARPHPGNVTR